MPLSFGARLRTLSRRRVVSFPLLALAPTAYLAGAIYVRCFGPAIFLARDATYYYLVNAFLVALGRGAHYFAHPGGPLLLLGGLLVRLKAIFFPESSLPLPDEFLIHHLAYATMLGTFLIAANAALLAAAGRSLRRRGLPWLLILMTQFSWLAVWRPWTFTGLFQAESFAIGTVSAFTIALFSRRRSRIRPLVMGMALSIKILYAPYLLLAALQGGVRRIAGSLAAGLGWALAGCLVLWPVWPILSLHMWELATREGPYGEGGMGLSTWQSFSAALDAASVGRELLLLALTACLAAPALLARKVPLGARRRFAVTLGVAIFSGLVFLRKPTHDYYLIPASLLAACVPASLYFVYRKKKALGLVPYLLCLILLSPCFSLPPNPGLFMHLQLARQFSEAAVESARPYEAVESRYGACSRLISGPIPLGVDALEMGADWAGQSLTGDLIRLYSNSFFLDGAPPRIRSFQIGQSQSPSDWWKLQGAGCVLLLYSRGLRPETINSLFPGRAAKQLFCDINLCVTVIGDVAK